MLRCIFGKSWENFDNTLSASANITSKQLLAFFMAWLMQFPFVCFPNLFLIIGTAANMSRCGYVDTKFLSPLMEITRVSRISQIPTGVCRWNLLKIPSIS